MKNPFTDNYGLNLLGIISIVIVCCIGFVALMSIPFYYASCREASVYNTQNGTAWTCADFFWASSQINSQSQTIKLQNP